MPTIDSADSAPLPRLWALRAISAGVLACGLGALLCTSRYLALPGAMRLDWTRMPLAIALVVLVAGVAMGVCVGGCTLLAAQPTGEPTGEPTGDRGPGPGPDRSRSTVARPVSLSRLITAGAVGGGLAGVGPGLLGIAGFGSLHAPYAGTANILSTILVTAIAFVALWSPQLFPTGRGVQHLVRATVASVVSLGAFGMMTWSVLRTFDAVPTFETLFELSWSMGHVPFATASGVLLGAVAGAAIGAACGLVARMSRADRQ